MLKINEQMYKYWKENGEEKFFQYSVLSWIMNLFVDERVKEWLVGEEFYKQQFQMKYIFLVVVDKFFVDQQLIKKGVSIFCFDEIQVIVIIKVSSIWVYLIVFVIWDYFVLFFCLQIVDVFVIVVLFGIMSRLLNIGIVFVVISN